MNLRAGATIFSISESENCAKFKNYGPVLTGLPVVCYEERVGEV
jgi:hypothetical protein